MEIKTHINDLLRDLANQNGRYSQADFDEVAMYVEVSSGSFHRRFVEVVRRADANFPTRMTSTDIEERIAIIDRLLRISDVSEALPQQTEDKNCDDELLPRFELNQADKARVLELCSQMRKIVLATEVFDQPHKRRLLNRIAGIEYQVEQPKGLLDIVRAGVSDVGETLGKFGTDIKPLTDRMNEVAGIARSGSKEYDQIPAPEELPKLPAPDNSDAEE